MIPALSGATIKGAFLFLGMANRDNRFVCAFARETSISGVRYSLCAETAVYYTCLFKQFRLKNDFVGGDAPNIKGVQGILTVEEAEQLVGGPVVQLLTCVRVDV